MTTANRKVRAAVIAASTATSLALLKVIAGLLTGSLAVVAAAVDSAMDLACSGLNAFFLRIAARGPDAEHAYGHGKAEALSGVVQATIIAMGGVWLVGRGIRRLLAPAEITNPAAGVAVSAVALAVSFALVLFLRREARVTQSIALHADAFHYVTDIATNTLAGVALVCYGVFGWLWVDPVASLLIAFYIIKSALDILRQAADELLDRGLGREVEEEIRSALPSFGLEVRGYSGFRSRNAGGTRFFELILLVDRNTTFERAHDLADAAERFIRSRHGADAQVMVHTDPV